MDAQKIQIAATMDIPRWSCVTSNGELADSNNPAHQGHVIGVTDGQMFNGRWGAPTVFGPLFNPQWAWTAGGPIFLNSTTLSQSPPGIGFVQQVGLALTAQSMLVKI